MDIDEPGLADHLQQYAQQRFADRARRQKEGDYLPLWHYGSGLAGAGAIARFHSSWGGAYDASYQRVLADGPGCEGFVACQTDETTTIYRLGYWQGQKFKLVSSWWTIPYRDPVYELLAPGPRTRLSSLAKQTLTA